jgi:hypothetical protein
MPIIVSLLNKLYKEDAFNLILCFFPDVQKLQVSLKV